MRTITLLAAVLTGCGEPQGLIPATAPLDADALPVPVVLQVSPVVLGGSMRLQVSGALADETVQVGRSLAGMGPGPCLSSLGGACLGLLSPVALHTTLRVGSDGAGTRTMGVPDVPTLDGMEACFQAAAIRGVDGTATVFSNPVCVDVGYDGDGDGVLDGFDVCAGFDDWFDWDLDGVPDGCDTGVGRPPTFETAAYSVPLAQTTFRNRAARGYIPPAPVGLVWLFHGAGGDSDLLTSPEVVVLMQSFIDRGYGVVAIDSDDRSNGVFDSTSAPNRNDDWARIDAFRDELVSLGVLGAVTPMYAVGFSAGGGFASWLANTALGQGWPMRAIALHSSLGFNEYYRSSLPPLPIAFVAGVNDDVVTPADMTTWYDRHRGTQPALYLLGSEERLAPTRFARSSFIDLERSEELFKVMVEKGWFDKRGVKRFGGDVDAQIDTIGADPDVTPSKPVKSVLSAVLATHAISALNAPAEADFFDSHR